MRPTHVSSPLRGLHSPRPDPRAAGAGDSRARTDSGSAARLDDNEDVLRPDREARRAGGGECLFPPGRAPAGRSVLEPVFGRGPVAGAGGAVPGLRVDRPARWGDPHQPSQHQDQVEVLLLIYR